MKKTLLSIVSAIAVAAVLTSCSVTVPFAVSAAPIGSKVGTSKTFVLGVWQLNRNWGIAEAAHNGKITGGVGVADLKITNYVIIIKKEIIAHGN
jgi:hypothetical protein